MSERDENGHGGTGRSSPSGCHSGPDARDLGLGTRPDRPVPDASATPAPVPIPILFEDEVLLVVDKPAGLTTMPRGRYVARSVVAQLRWARGERHLVAAHRLDRLTSGVLVLVKDPAWRGRVQTLFEHRARGLRKHYVAHTLTDAGTSEFTEAAAPFLAGTRSDATPFEVSLPMLKARGRWQTLIDPDGRTTRTRLERTGEAEGRMTWSLTPLTGYTHQLRVTLAALGHPILGDPLYPRVTEEYTSEVGDTARMFLHAESLTLPRPDGGPAWPTFTAPPPWVAQD